MKNYYKVLELTQDASQNEIEEAYKILTQKYNPNRKKGDRYVEERFIDITLAYKTLRDSEKRKDYDRILKSLLLDIVTENVETQEKKKVQKIVQRRTIRATYVALTIFLLSAVWMLRHELFASDNIQYKSTNVVNEIPKDTAKNEEHTVIPENAPIIQANPKSITTPVKPTDHKLVKENKNVHVIKTTAKDTAALIPIKAASEDSTGFAIGDSKSAVLTIQGTPGTITKYNDGTEIWNYGKSTVFFEGSKLKAYNNIDNNLLLKK